MRGISNYIVSDEQYLLGSENKKPDIVFLQETHSTQGNEVFWQREWVAILICSHGANNARGVAILIRNNFDCVVKESVIGTVTVSKFSLMTSAEQQRFCDTTKIQKHGRLFSTRVLPQRDWGGPSLVS